MNLLVIKPRPSLATLEMSEPGPAATPLAGKTMLVTGAGGTLGRSLVELGRSLGASVVAWVRTPSAELGDDVRQIVGDLRSEQELVRGAALAGEIDILVNNAAVLDGELAAVLAINVIAPHELIGRFVPGMIARRFGRIINITSDLSVVPSGDHL